MKIRYDKTYSELWNLTESEDVLLSDVGHMAIKTIKGLEEEARQLRIENKEIKDAYDDRCEDIDYYNKTLMEIKEYYELNDENKLDELLHSLFTNEIYDDSY